MVVLIFSVLSVLTGGCLIALLLRSMKELRTRMDGVESEILKMEKLLEEFISRSEGMVEAAADFNAIVKDASDNIVVQSTGLRSTFGVIAGRLVALSDGKKGNVPNWFSPDSQFVKAMASESGNIDERTEFEYSSDNVVSKTYRNGTLFCEVRHDAFGGVKEGTIFDAAGAPKRRFVYDDKTEQTKED